MEYHNVPRWIHSTIPIRCGPFTTTVRDLHLLGCEIYEIDEYMRDEVQVAFRLSKHGVVGACSMLRVPMYRRMDGVEQLNFILSAMHNVDIGIEFFKQLMVREQPQYMPRVLPAVWFGETTPGTLSEVFPLEFEDEKTQVIITDSPTVSEMLDEILKQQKPEAQRLLKKQGELERYQVKAKILSL